MKSAREWGDFGFSDEQMLERLRALPKIKPGPAVRTFYEAYMEQQGKPRWGEKTPTYVQKMKLIQRALPEARFVHVIRDGRDVALGARPDGSRPDRGGRRASLEAKDHQGARGLAAARALHRGPLRGSDPRHGAGPAPRLRVHRAPGTTRCSTTTSDRASGCRRWRARCRATGAPRSSASSRMATHAMTTKPPSADRVARWRTEMSAEQRTEFERLPGTCSTSSIRPARCRRAGDDLIDEAPCRSG